MTWLRRLVARWRARNDTVMSAMALQVYRRPEGVALVVSCEQGEVLMLLDRARTAALCDLLMDTIEEPGPAAPGVQ